MLDSSVGAHLTMPNKPSKQTSAPAASLPSVDEVLGQERTVRLVEELGRDRVLAMVRSLLGVKRADLLAGVSPLSNTDRTSLLAELTDELTQFAAAERQRGVQRVINATGVILHTNLGRAPLSGNAVAAMTEAAGYTTIEYDLASGSRGRRGAKVVDQIRLLTGAEDALVVNNCAAATLLVLSAFAVGKEVIVSRGELVEIGGDFRIPDILTRSGAVLREVGTTNRTHLRDYENAIGDNTGMILKVHPSNFRITGFTKSPDTGELSELSRSRGLIFYEDAGSGAIVDLQPFGVSGEPIISRIITSGADLVSFSGDKLLGGPQAGIIAGRRDRVEQLRRDPFYRALRLDKIMTAALEATLEEYLKSNGRNIPVLRMLSETRDSIAERAAKFVEKVKLNPESGLKVDLIEGSSAVGGGAAPDAELRSTLIALNHASLSDTEIETKLRTAPVPIIARIDNGRVLIDLRTVDRREEAAVITALAELR